MSTSAKFKRATLWGLAGGVIVLGVALALTVGRGLRPPELLNSRAGTEVDGMASAELIARGKYLAQAGDCIACHTIPGG